MAWGKSYEKKEMEFKPIPKGRYECILDDCKINKTDKNGTLFLEVNGTIISGEFTNRKLFHKLWFTDGAYNMTAQQLDNLLLFDSIGEANDVETYLTKAADQVFKLVGKKIEMSVTGHQEYNGKTYENVFITKYLDVVNEAIQKKTDNVVIAKAKTTPQTVDTNEEIPF